ncbi:NAD(P)H-binding protein [Paenibacillus aurantiacus]|uniref:NAD(P)H-binding protein n=1 Tax=Paenibacillus aurantiacus TaxID=1936118 RepID=A0ABV5KZW3_9BACL
MKDDTRQTDSGAKVAPYNALVVGATGLVGSELVRQLSRDASCAGVTVLVRRPLIDPSLQQAAASGKLRVIVADLERLEEALAGVEADVVYCALGTTIRTAGSQEAFRKVDYEYPVRLGAWAARHEARMVVVSAMGASVASRIFYSRVKGEMEQALTAEGLPELHVLRPSLLMGKRDEFRLVERVAVLLTPIVRWALVGPLRKYQPITDREVARAMRAVASGAGKTAAAASGDGTWIYENDGIAEAASRIG